MNCFPKHHPASLVIHNGNARDDSSVMSGHSTPGKQRIILADDHPVVLLGAQMALADNTCAIVAQAHNADELIAHLERTPCDLLVSDYSMPYGCFPDGLALMGYLRRHHGHIPLIVMTMLNNPSLLRALLRHGARGLFDKRCPLIELKQAVHTVARGRSYLSPSFADLLRAPAPSHSNTADSQASLSERELEVVRLFVQGLSGRQIAAQLNRSEKTISRQKRTAMDKLGLDHDGGLVEFARVSGLRST
jgi:two-component system capsular synthesis response regulator RcsB